MRKTVVIKVSYEIGNVSYAEIEQAIENLPIDDIDLLEEYED